jgi:hypothetical protein
MDSGKSILVALLQQQRNVFHQVELCIKKPLISALSDSFDECHKTATPKDDHKMILRFQETLADVRQWARPVIDQIIASSPHIMNHIESLLDTYVRIFIVNEELVPPPQLDVDMPSTVDLLTEIMQLFANEVFKNPYLIATHHFDEQCQEIVPISPHDRIRYAKECNDAFRTIIQDSIDNIIDFEMVRAACEKDSVPYISITNPSSSFHDDSSSSETSAPKDDILLRKPKTITMGMSSVAPHNVVKEKDPLPTTTHDGTEDSKQRFSEISKQEKEEDSSSKDGVIDVHPLPPPSPTSFLALLRSWESHLVRYSFENSQIRDILKVLNSEYTPIQQYRLQESSYSDEYIRDVEDTSEEKGVEKDIEDDDFHADPEIWGNDYD